MTQKAKGPAEAATSPDHGSNIPQEETKMNIQSNSTSPRAVSLRILDAINELNYAECFVEAVFMAASHIGDGAQTGAIQTVAEEARKRLNEIEKILDGVREELQ